MKQDQLLFIGRLLTAHEVEQIAAADQIDPPWELLQSVPAMVDGYCVRCNNQTEMGYLPDGQRYCLSCLNLGRIVEGDELYYMPTSTDPLPDLMAPILTWEGQLSQQQSFASQELIGHLSDPRPHCITAVTGAGKTEMIFEVIALVLARGGRVGVSSPRVDVCLELFPRLQAAFNRVPIHLLYGGSQEVYRYTPLVILTTHQLLRFRQAFDLLIIDEVDAFPLANDPHLHYGIQQAVKTTGKLVYLTATPDESIQQAVTDGQMIETTLPARYHGYPLPEPVFVWIGDWQQQIKKRRKRGRLYRQLCRFLNQEGVKLIFMPSIAYAEELFSWLSTSQPELAIACVHAKDPQRNEKVLALREGRLEALITTTILERGVTFTHCHVYIVGAQERIYSVAALVQMSGRAGRKVDYPTGQVIYGHFGRSRAMIRARSDVQAMNHQAEQRGLLR